MTVEVFTTNALRAMLAVAITGATVTTLDYIAKQVSSDVGTFSWVAPSAWAAGQLGMKTHELRKAIHDLKDASKVCRPDTDVEIDIETGDVRIKSTGEEIGNVYDG